MAGTDNHRNSGSRRVNMKIWGGVPSFNRNLSRHQLSCLLVLRLLSYASSRRRRRRRRRKHGQNGKNIFGYNIHIWCFFTEIFGILFSFHILSAITGYGSTLYIGIAMVFVFPPYIRKLTSCFHFQVILTFNNFMAFNM